MRWPLVRRSTLDAAEYDRDIERGVTEILMGDLATVRRTVRVVRGERDYLATLLRAIRAEQGDVLPDAWVRRVNSAVALESEGDIAEAAEKARSLAAEVTGEPR